MKFSKAENIIVTAGRNIPVLHDYFCPFCHFLPEMRKISSESGDILSHAPYLDIFLADEGYRGSVLDFYLEPALTGTCEDYVFI